MKNRHSYGSRMCASIVALALGGLVACQSQDQVAQDQGSGSDESLTIALTTVPASTLCIRVTAKPSSGAAATVKSFIVTSGSSSANLQMGVLLPETYSLTADAFNVACSSVSGAGIWIADPVTVTLRPGVAQTVTLTFRKNSSLGVKADFVNNVKSVIAGNMASYVVTDTDVLVSGSNYPSGPTFKRSGFPAFDSTSVPGNAVVTVAPTYGGACALRADGTVWCWGYNSFGELGPGALMNKWQTTPVQVPGIWNATMIAAGDYHVCVAGSGVKCWGRNDQGQLGDGTGIDSPSPVSVSVGFTPAFLAAGGNSTYLVTGGPVYCAWGDNGMGQLGDGSSTDRLSPVLVHLPAPPLSISAGRDFACTLTASGVVLCWGNNGSGQLGDGTTTNRLTPVAVVGLSAKQVAVSDRHSCALTVGDQTVCWGSNDYYQLGNRSITNALIPTPVALDGITLVSLSSGGGATCGISQSLDVYCWGFNAFGTHGNGTELGSSFPVRAQLE
jgi:alpha-tubulin suppressor-like RCC1 family protein